MPWVTETWKMELTAGNVSTNIHPCLVTNERRRIVAFITLACFIKGKVAMSLTCDSMICIWYYVVV